MADVAQYAPISQAGELKPAEVKFYGSTARRNNMALGVGMIIAGALSFMMGMTDVFFAEATAWTFVIWGALFVYTGLIDEAQAFVVTDDALVLRNSMRPFSRAKVWPWKDINRVDVVVKRTDARDEDSELRVYYMEPGGEITIEREDRQYSPALARLIIERTGLAPAGEDNPTDFEHLPQGKAVYTWQ